MGRRIWSWLWLVVFLAAGPQAAWSAPGDCEPDCVGKSCGPDGCGGSCGECSGLTSCIDGLCAVAGCEPNKYPGCGGCPCEECVCLMDSFCCEVQWDGLCAAECVDFCDGCALLEDCGDGKCDLSVGESCSNCKEDCACLPPTSCFKGFCCQPSCEGKECGDDGCGGPCSTCPVGQVCENEVCVTPPSCEVAKEFHCDQTAVFDNSLFSNIISAYPCGNWNQLGPELGLSFVAPADDQVQVTVAGIGFNVEVQLYVLEGACAAAACILFAQGGKGSFTAKQGATYFLAIDSYDYNSAGKFVISVACLSTCEPDCTGKKCGDDGCLGSCGECPSGTVCQSGQCAVQTGCEPNSSPGCGGCPCEECVCGFFPDCCWWQWNTECVAICQEMCGGCADLSKCGDGLCDEAAGETCTNCSVDCPCGPGKQCYKGSCCVPDCTGLECGYDQCGNWCGDCDEGLVCISGKCGVTDGCQATGLPGCGGCLCEECVCWEWPECCWEGWGEMCAMLCNEYCGGCGSLENCGDGKCDMDGKENCSNCPDDCQCGPGELCSWGECCLPYCGDAVCGDDGCGGSCGSCPPGQGCSQGKCTAASGCIAAPFPGCGGCACEQCVCEMDEYCCSVKWDDICVDECIGQCGGCGPVDECGDGKCQAGEEDCGSCPQDCSCTPPAFCYKASCCTPDCAGKECGPDQCGGACGICPEGQFCSFTNLCESQTPVEPEADLVTQPDIATDHAGEQSTMPESGPEPPEALTGEFWCDSRQEAETVDTAPAPQPSKTKSGSCSTSENAGGLSAMLVALAAALLFALGRRRRVSAR